MLATPTPEVFLHDNFVFVDVNFLYLLTGSVVSRLGSARLQLG